jgi:RNA polymerase sigma factor (sigma-70 family)
VLAKKSKNKKPPTILSQAKHWTDKAIIQYIIEKGDSSLFGELYDRYANKVYRKCISMVRIEADAEDLSHEIMVKAFVNISGFAGNSSFSTWIYSITYNHCIDFIRQKKKIQKVQIENEEGEIVLDQIEEDTAAEIEIFEFEVAQLKILIHELTEEDRALLLMKYQDDLSIEDIKDILGISPSAVKMRLKRARDRLKKMRKPY